ncbi:pilus assembly protein CpaE [Marisediminicola sp. LYQ85]|uniref:pilus assembly protein CpaE n=1 Tax=Marisediminicola sp. LYQ85 TaxID=3391062 RepID=UPI0039837401
MIATELARALRDSGLTWHPEPGDAFRIDRPEADGDVFVLSEMTVEAHHYPTGTVLGFNGTTEWALDSIELDDTLWLPHEGQLRFLLARTFRSLVAAADGRFEVNVVIDDEALTFVGVDAADAYGRALLDLLDRSHGGTVEDEPDGVPWSP